MGLQQIQAVISRTTSESNKNYNAEQSKQERVECSTTSMARSNARIAAVENIWAVLGSRYGHAWTTRQVVDDQIAMNDWCDAVAGLRFSDIKVGLEKTKTDLRFRSHPPNSMEFRSLCINDDEEKGLLFKELVNWGQLDQSEKTSKGLFIVRNIDYTLFRRADNKQARKMFDEAYLKLLKHLSEDRPLPEFAVEIEYEEKPALPKEELRSRLQGILGSLGA